MGERPAILSRGYARRRPADGVVVVRDAEGIRADVDRSGDEPSMLAHALDGVAVLVSGDRYLAGRLAELHLGVTVHVLDDGFQHLQLWRDADIVALTAGDLRDRTLPGGRLREGPDALAAADAVIALDDVPQAVVSGGRPCWRARRELDTVARELRGVPVAALAGIADPAAFFAALRQAQLTVTHELPFRDHHRYTAKDVARIVGAAKAGGARAVVTTEKDLARLKPFRPFALPVVAIPLRLEIDQAAGFDAWLASRLTLVRQPA
jgi:tetraacyldisaccharide 4'-kinase